MGARRAMTIRIVTRSHAAGRDQLVDVAIDSYINWREQSRAVVEAYEMWAKAPGAQRPLAFFGYQAALDQEELATSNYASALQAVQLALNPDREAAT